MSCLTKVVIHQIIEDINKEEKICYKNIDKLINKPIHKIEEKYLKKSEVDKDETVDKKEDMDEKEKNVVLSENLNLPFPEKKKNGKKKKKKRNKK